MGRNDMDHMQHIEDVALSDCAVLQSKEATYQGSWKRAGGRSAWFMTRRNMDRLLTMMPAKPVCSGVDSLENIRATLMSLKQTVHYNFAPLSQTIAPLPGTIEATMAVLDHVLDAYTSDDVFARIAERPKGEDGTVLAVIRDLRRYFILVEAEMIAEGVVEPESKTYEQENGMYRPPDTDVYQLIADDKKLTREEVKARVHEIFYGDERPVASLADKDIPTVDVHKGSIFTEGWVFEKGQKRRRATQEELNAMGRGGPPDYALLATTPEAGSHHASLVPWEIGSAYRDTLIGRVGGEIVYAFFNQRVLGVYRLEGVVDGGLKCPREINQCYNWHRDNETRSYWVLKRGDVPLELEDQFPRLQQEMNAFEYEQSPPEYKFMYVFVEGPQKWTLADKFADWARTA